MATSYAGPTVSWPRLKTAIDQCCQKHSNCHVIDKLVLPRGFRLIDVARRCIVETSNVPFAALSYVWGADTRPSLLTATRDTITAMSKNNGLSAADMPRTIEDAMAVCINIGIKYLWADRLCIVQDDPEDKTNQIMTMDAVYASALLVIISGSGDSMDFGIAGVSRLRPVPRNLEASWQTRGWTYQEAVCAKRLLHFTNTRAYFECQNSTTYEDAFDSDTMMKQVSMYALRLQDESSVFEAFRRHLANYSSRKLSFSSDVYNAFIGIANLLYGSNYTETFLSGLPKVDFDRALRWYAWHGETDARRLDTPGFVCPTWSWTSAMVIAEQIRYQDTEFYGSLALWTVKESDTEQWQALNVHPDTEVDANWQIYMAIASQEGCLQNAPTLKSMITWEKTRVCWPDYYTFCENVLLDSEEPLNPNQSTHNASSGFLTTVAQTAFLQLGKRQYNRKGLSIIDPDGNAIGELCGEVTKFTKEALAQRNTSFRYEFIVVSLSGLHVFPWTGDEQQTKNYFDGNGEALEMLPIINVFLIERREDFAYRKELGWVYLKDWGKLDRHWRSVVLG